MGKGVLITWAQRLFLGALVIALLVFGLSATGETASQLTFSDGSAWLSTWERGEAVQVNSASAEVTARAQVSEKGQRTQIDQLGQDAVVLNTDTGEFGVVSGVTLEYSPTANLAVTSELVAGSERAYLVDRAASTVQAVDVDTHIPGDPVPVPDGPYSFAPAPDGSLWIAAIESGQVVRVNGSQVSAPRRVADDDHTIHVATVADEPVVVDATGLSATQLDPSSSAPGQSVCLTDEGLGTEGIRVAGSDPFGETMLAATLSPADGDLLISDFDTRSCARVAIGGLGETYGPILIHDDAVFIPNRTLGKVVVVDAAKRAVRYNVQVAPPGSPIEVFTDGEQVWFNNPAGPEAGTLDAFRLLNRLDKYTGTVLPKGDQITGEGTASMAVDGSAEDTFIEGDEPTDSASEQGQDGIGADEEADTTTTTQPAEPRTEPDRPQLSEDNPNLTVLPPGVLAPPLEDPDEAAEPEPALAEPPAPSPTTTALPNQLVANFKFSGDGKPKIGELVLFEDLSAGSPTRWSWDFGDGTSSVGRVASKTWNQAAERIDVVLTVSRDGFTAQAVASFQVIDPKTIETPPPPIAQIRQGPNRAEMGQVIPFISDAGGGKADTLTWDFGDGTTAEGPEVSHSWATPGTYQLRLTAANAQGSSIATRSMTIVDQVQPPTAIINASTQSVLTDESVVLRSDSTGEPTELTWTFDDEQSATGPEVTHAWNQPGTYTVTLAVSNSAGEDSTTTEIEVRARALKPEARIGVVGGTDVEAGTEVAFQDQSLNEPTELEWDFDDGEKSINANPTKVWAKAGTYEVTLTATNEAGSDKAEVKIRVLPARDPAPEADFRVQPDRNRIRTGTTVTFTDRSENVPTTWAWDFGDGTTADTPNPTHVYANPGNYSVLLTVTNATGRSEIAKNVRVRGQAIPPPVAGFQFPNPPWRVGEDIPFTDASQGVPVEWRWSFGDGSPVDTRQNPTHRFTAAGTYIVQLIIRDATGRESESAAFPLKIDAAHAATFTWAPVPAVAGQPVTFTDTSPQPATLTRPTWRFAPGPTGQVVSPPGSRAAVWTFPATGPANVTMTVCLVANPAACSTSTQTVQVAPAPAAPVAAFNLAGPAKPATIGPNDALINLPLQLVDASTGAGLADPTTTFVWTIGNRPPQAGRVIPPIIVNAVGVLPISLMVTTPHGTNTITRQIRFLTNLAPVAKITAPAKGFAGTPVTFTDASANGATSWSWDFGDQVPPAPPTTTQNPTHLFAQPGKYTVTLQSANHIGPSVAPATHVITIELPPPLPSAIGVSAGPAPLLAPISVPAGTMLTFTDTTPVPAGQTSTRTWTIQDLPPGPLPVGPSVNHVWTIPGTYTVRLDVTNQYGTPSPPVTIEVIVT